MHNGSFGSVRMPASAIGPGDQTPFEDCLGAIDQNGRVEQSNFHDYLPMRIDDVPVVETHLVKSAEPPGGIGEAPTAAVGPAVANAIFAATGKRIRTLPIMQ